MIREEEIAKKKSFQGDKTSEEYCLIIKRIDLISELIIKTHMVRQMITLHADKKYPF
ncbi:MAG: hypothetical protein QM478_13545 [Flavobacteriaceae bacterium]